MFSNFFSENLAVYEMWKNVVKPDRLQTRDELSYLVPLGSENISAPYFKQCFFRGGGITPPQTESKTTPPSPKTKIYFIY